MTTPQQDAVPHRVLPPTIVSLFDTITERSGIDPEIAKALDTARSAITGERQFYGPFLSVLLRTQGKRIEPFKDAMLCLAAQTDQDFHVVVLVHDALDEDAQKIHEIVASQLPDFAARISVIEINGGTRARPLNVGLAAATGKYIAVYDDDDLLFANWVESFKAASGDGLRLLRSVVANQRVSPELWPQDQEGFRTLSWPNPEYAHTFDILQHLLVNHSPFMTWAFPAALFTSFGVRFDEELTVCEDWDMILTGSLLFGVDEINELTSIYRRWDGGVSSYTLHSTDSWRASEQRVIDRLDSTALLLPPGSMANLRKHLLLNDGLRQYGFLFRGNGLRPPLNWGLAAATPGIKLAVRVRDRVRRMRSR